MTRRQRIPLCLAVLLSAAGRLLADDGPEPATPPPPPKPIEYVEYRGVVFRTPDGLFEGSMGFNFQFRFTHFDLDAAAGGIDANEFRVRRFKLFFSGFALDPRLTWRLQLEFAGTAANRILDDAWLNWKFSNAVSVQGGEYKTPYAREELYNDGFLQFPERSIAVDAFKPSRDIGVMGAGSFCNGLFAYQAGVFGGDGQNTVRATNHVMPVVRMVFNPIGVMGNSEADLQGHTKPALSIGANGFTNTLKKLTATTFEAQLNYAGPTGWLGRNIRLFEEGEDVDVKSWGVDAQFKWMGLSVQGEGFWGQAKGDTSGVRLYSYGYYAQAGYFLIPGKWDLATRYSYIDYNRNAPRGRISTVTGETSYYFRKGSNSFKVLLDYTRTHRLRADGAPANDSGFLIQAQLMP